MCWYVYRVSDGKEREVGEGEVGTGIVLEASSFAEVLDRVGAGEGRGEEQEVNLIFLSV